jgi:hypothetical protein
MEKSTLSVTKPATKKTSHKRPQSKRKVASKQHTELTNRPISNLVKIDDVPKNILSKLSKFTSIVDSPADLKSEAKVNTFEVLNNYLQYRYPTVLRKQDCTDVISGYSDDDDRATYIEIQKGSLLALIAYALPYYISEISLNLHQKNSHFMNYLASHVAESTSIAYNHTNQILQQQITSIPLPPLAQMAGFYIRTPIEIYQGKKRIYDIPDWDHREDLLQYKVHGNVNVYVLRRNVQDGFECYILFRGSSNEFNAIPQYGSQMRNTQIYNVPQYDPIDDKSYPEGSDQVALFHVFYMDMIRNVLPHILQCLAWLSADAPTCQRIVVAGHSMGGALVLNFCYLMKIWHPKWWDKMFFRAYASPMCCNDAAVLKIEQWLIDSMQTNKFIEVINTDDLVNLQYLLGGKKGLKESIQKGTNQIGYWMISNQWAQQQLQRKQDQSEDNRGVPEVSTDGVMNRMLRIIQVYPEVAFALFLNGALEAQVKNVPEQKEASFRLGQRVEEVKLWESHALKNTYNGTMKLFYCKRRVNWQNEYLGKSHSNYVDINMSILWAPLRSYEDDLYRFYHQNSLKQNNHFILLPIFPHKDLEKILPLVDAYVTNFTTVNRDHQKNSRKK